MTVSYHGDILPSRKETCADSSLEWTPEKLSSMCATPCRDDILELSDAMKRSCQQEVLHLQLGNLTLADYGALLQYRAEHLCLHEEDSAGGFCLLASAK